MTSVTLEHLTKAFTPAHADEKKVTAVRDLNMKITSGDVLAILGLLHEALVLLRPGDP